MIYKFDKYVNRFVTREQYIGECSGGLPNPDMLGEQWDKMETYISILRPLELDNSILERNYKKGKISIVKFTRECDKNRIDASQKIINHFKANENKR